MLQNVSGKVFVDASVTAQSSHWRETSCHDEVRNRVRREKGLATRTCERFDSNAAIGAQDCSVITNNSCESGVFSLQEKCGHSLLLSDQKLQAHCGHIS